MNKRLLSLIPLLLAALWLSSPQRAFTQTLSPATALGPGFTYQGFLKNASGNPITSICDLRFSLFDTQSGGTKIGVDSTVLGASVSQGYFSALANAGSEFGAGALDNANARWLEVAVKCTGDAGFTVLVPRQPLSRSLQTHDHFGQTWSGTGTGLSLNGGSVGLSGNGTSYGVWGQTSSGSGRGVFGRASSTSGTNYGVWGQSDSTSGLGVLGWGSATSGTNYGVWGQSDSTSGLGVLGWASATSGTNYGVWGQSDSNNGRGVYGYTSAQSSTNYGVYGYSIYGLGVYGYTSLAGAGVYGESASTNGRGVIGVASSTTGVTNGVYGRVDSPSGYAGLFIGNVQISGTLTKAGGGFKIDHPLDPANQYLYHSFVESPEMTNVYNGTASLDNNGQARVQLPTWFEALNQDFHYQLTPLGGSMPDLYVAQGVQNNNFLIAGGTPGMQVSWLLTGVRHDPWAEANRQEVEQPKAPEDLGKYLHPELYGMPKEMTVNYQAIPEMVQGEQAPAFSPPVPIPPTPAPPVPAPETPFLPN